MNNNKRLKENTSYTNNVSDIGIHIHKIKYTGSKYVKVRGSIFRKKCGYVYETKNYKLYFDKIADWKKYE